MSELIKEGRKLVTIRKVNAINPIPGADAIEVAVVDGWEVVIKKGEFAVDELCVFFEIDSFLPANNPAFAFLLRNGTKKDEEGTERIRLKSVRLRGQLSQGLALPIKGTISTEVMKELLMVVDYSKFDTIDSDVFESMFEALEDSREGIEQFLNITKYERPSERNGGTGAGNAKTAGSFPYYCKKTDAERLQNLYNKYSQLYSDVEFRPSLKMDGSSTTIAFVSDEKYFIDKINDDVKVWNEETQELEVKYEVPYPFKDENGMIIVCSRNLALKYDVNSSFWKAIHHTQIHNKMKSYCIQYDRQLAIQAELVGPGINGNWDKFEYHDLYAFHIWDIDKQCYIDDDEFQDICNSLQIQTTPQFKIIKPFKLYESLHDFLNASDIPSINNPISEGIVYKSTKKIHGSTLMFKVINNKYLLS